MTLSPPLVEFPESCDNPVDSFIQIRHAAGERQPEAVRPAERVAGDERDMMAFEEMDDEVR
jgi:hypothetical protein